MMMKSFYLASALLVSVVFTGCVRMNSGDDRADAPALQTGKACTVQFRRDALGAGANLPVPPMTNSLNGADVSIVGTLKRATAEWVVIEKSRKDIWIPKSVILLIEQ